jgi:hypothetical protein
VNPDFEFRVVQTPQSTAPSRLMMYRMPNDLIELGRNRSDDLDAMLQRLQAGQ